MGRKWKGVKPKCMCTNPEIRKKGGFTLLEVVLSLVIFALIAVGVMQSVSATLLAIEELKSQQSEDAAIQQLIRSFGKKVQSLPPNARLTLEMLQEEPLIQELRIEGSSGGFIWEPGDYAENRLDLASFRMTKPDGGERHVLAASRPGFGPTQEESPDTGAWSLLSGMPEGTQPDDDGRYWIALLQPLGGIAWSCYNPETEEWTQSWSGNEWPRIVAMEILPEGSDTWIRHVFVLPEKAEESDV
jgi:prepilin-type N-terminal cleavage/methylation domain-containing protein